MMKVGAIQLCSELEPEKNLKKIRAFMDEATQKRVEAVFLPECFYSMSDGLTPTPYLVAFENEHYRAIQSLASDYGLYILGGSAATAGENGKIYNRSYNFDPDGNDLGQYDKRNLFACDLKKAGKSKVIDEREIYSAGSTPRMITAKEMNLGLSICFDLRYPALYQDYVAQGANALSISAAFTVPTGKAHWHILVRARAIENQCFVIASAQWGRHNDRIQTYGHSLLVDPWGRVLADAEEGERLIVADFDFSQVEFVRKSVKVFQ